MASSGSSTSSYTTYCSTTSCKVAQQVEELVLQITNPLLRPNAILELRQMRNISLGPWLWYSFGTIAALLQEIVSIYPALLSLKLTTEASNRACNAVSLLQ
ncbi:cell differentiation protein RCD1-like protein, partial [Thalictrum thalictroides]